METKLGEPLEEKPREPFSKEEGTFAALKKLVRRNKAMTFFAALFFIPLLLGAVYFSYTLFSAPKLLTAGILEGAPDVKVIEALRDALPASKAKVRLLVKLYPDLPSIVAAMEKKDIDLAVHRSDAPFPANARAVVNLREVSVSFLVMKSAELKDIGALTGKRIDVVSQQVDAVQFVTAILAGTEAKKAVIGKAVSLEDAGKSLRSNAAAAIAIVDSPDRRFTRAAWKVIASSAGKPVELLPQVEADELAAANPGITQDKIAAKSISQRPPFPEEELTIAKVSYLLLARQDIDRNYIASLTATLFTRRIEIARKAPGVNTIKTIDNDYVTSSLIPVHDGALDYFRREQMNFYERYNDLIWLVILYGGSLFSGFVWLGQSMFRSRRENERNLLEDLAAVLEKSQAAISQEELEHLRRAVDDIIRQCLAFAHTGVLSQKRLTAIWLGYGAVQQALAHRKAAIAQEMDPDKNSAGAPPEPPEFKAEQLPESIVSDLERKLRPVG